MDIACTLESWALLNFKHVLLKPWPGEGSVKGFSCPWAHLPPPGQCCRNKCLQGWCTYSRPFVKISKIKWKLWTALKKDFFCSFVFSSVCVLVGSTCVCVCVVHVCVCLWVVYATECGCPQRPAEGIESPGAGVIGGYELPAWVLGTRLLTSTRVVHAPNHRATSRGPWGTFWWKTNVPEILFSD